MKQGRTLEELGLELQRQRNARQDFVADSRSLSFATDDGGSRLSVVMGGKMLDFGPPADFHPAGNTFEVLPEDAEGVSCFA